MGREAGSEAGGDGVGRVDYFEIGTPQPQAAREFYGGLFGWPVGEPSTPAQYSMVDEGRGGLWDTSAIGGEAWAIFYVRVADVRAALARAQELGATVAMPFIDNGAIEFAHLVDPLGNRFGIWRPKDATAH
jgi:predicted enzyme related to lactoylglutathione lyase